MPPAHKPTDESRKRVKALASRGVPQEFIAIAVGLSDKSVDTLRKHYENEIAEGALNCRSRLLNLAHVRAEKSDAVLIFLLKTLCGLKERDPSVINLPPPTINFVETPAGTPRKPPVFDRNIHDHDDDTTH